LSPGHKADGAEFNRFGVLNVNKQFDSGGTLWLAGPIIHGEREDFGRDPQWEGSGNRRTYDTRNVRPRFDFGYSRTRHAGGQALGELGGLLFRGDCRDGDRLAAYGDRLSPLTLDWPLRASGTVCLRRAVFRCHLEELQANRAHGRLRQFRAPEHQGPQPLHPQVCKRRPPQPQLVGCQVVRVHPVRVQVQHLLQQ
jgi:hypothetical protein